MKAARTKKWKLDSIKKEDWFQKNVIEPKNKSEAELKMLIDKQSKDYDQKMFLREQEETMKKRNKIVITCQQLNE